MRKYAFSSYLKCFYIAYAPFKPQIALLFQPDVTSTMGELHIGHSLHASTIPHVIERKFSRAPIHNNVMSVATGPVDAVKSTMLDCAIESATSTLGNGGLA